MKKLECNLELFVIKVENADKVVFWLPYKIYNYYKSTNCQKAIKAKDGSGIWPMSDLLEYITDHQK
jgi:hypothetical protein